MDIADIRTNRETLERAIAVLCEDFSRRTGCEVTLIWLEAGRGELADGGKIGTTYTVRVTARI